MTGQFQEKFRWSDEAVALLRKMADAGRSSQDMADELYNRFGGEISRNSVIGKCHRLKIQLTGKGTVAAGRAPVVRKRNPIRRDAIVAANASGAAVSMPPRPATDGDRAVSPLPVANPIHVSLAAHAPPAEPATGSGEEITLALLPVDPEFDPALDDAYDPLSFTLPPESYFGPTRFIEARADQCRWFITDSSTYDAPVCGERHVVGFSYCDEHAARVHTTAGLDPKHRRAAEKRRERMRHMGLSIAGV